ncbi:hypothetical protein DID88_006921 [Monilinia fructigena]|uniref:DUF4149 domain-containing protein n=1 Tax=Monilinia fructigena TaxID=38457 RepID=A0A395IGK4_9HELO|nr:hypothetical protein DID88_006921 [Monilinia fructigena]
MPDLSIFKTPAPYHIVTYGTLLAITYPGSRTNLGTVSGISGALAEVNRWSVLVPLGTMFVTGLANLVLIGPATTRLIKERKHQETRDGKKSYDAAPHSREMQKLNKSFGRLHGASSLVNLVSFLATIWYGVSLAERLQ